MSLLNPNLLNDQDDLANGGLSTIPLSLAYQAIITAINVRLDDGTARNSVALRYAKQNHSTLLSHLFTHRNK